MAFTIKGVRIGKKSIDRFWSRVAVTEDPDECWLWQAGVNSKKWDYGIFYLSEIKGGYLTHKLALSIHYGVEITTEAVRHTCDTPRCCNPRHLIPGSKAQNVKDMMKRGRHNPVRGEKQPTAKLTDDKVRQIRKLHRLHVKYKGMNYTKLSKMFGVDKALISRVVARTSWAHVED